MAEILKKLVIVKSDSKLDNDGKQILATIKHIDRKKFEIFLLCPPGPLSVEAKMIGDIKVFNVRIQHLFYLNSYFSLKKILQKIRGEAPVFEKVILHTYGFWPAFWIKYIKFEEFVYVHSVSYQKLDYKILSSQNLIFTPFSLLAESILNHCDIGKEKVKTIPQAVDIKKINATHSKQRIKHINNAPVVGVYFHHFAKKEVNLILSYLHSLRRVYPLALINVITETYDKKVNSILSLHNANHFITVSPEVRMKEFMNRWDLFINHSADHEKGVTAMFAGIPTIISKKIHVSDTLGHKKHGLHYDNENDSLMKRSIELLRNPALAAKFKRDAKEHSKKFSFENIAKLIEKEYDHLLKAN